MKYTILLLSVLLFACNDKQREDAARNDNASGTMDSTQKQTPERSTNNTYSNERFRNVTAEEISGDSVLVHGEAQIFEASFSWSLRDGDKEVMKGFTAADAGAPAWGKFQFSFHIPEGQKYSTLTLILFEASAKDGTPQHQLEIVLSAQPQYDQR